MVRKSIIICPYLRSEIRTNYDTFTYHALFLLKGQMLMYQREFVWDLAAKVFLNMTAPVASAGNQRGILYNPMEPDLGYFSAFDKSVR